MNNLFLTKITLHFRSSQSLMLDGKSRDGALIGKKYYLI